ncbi:maltodextrin glucosidase [Corallincola platygyrae]|uniref:Maltodextrin glucosidase n=1 Tax=Corallincola platygyrae TaxID=1193278 RepID=A0ABW4XP90_9GAMM
MLPSLLHVEIAPFVETDIDQAIIRLFSRQVLSKVWLRAEPNNEEYLVELSPKSLPNGTLWHGLLPLNPAASLNLYSFKCLQGSRLVWLSAAGETPHPPARQLQFRYLHNAGPAHWMREQVWYQIFPDRFACGDPETNVKSGEFEYQGLPVKALPWEHVPGQNRPGLEFYGGDLKGIEDRLDYLQQMGITALSLNPIFTSASVHKYNPDSYDTVAPHLGGNGAFASLCESLHQRGMKIMLDAVVNHTGDNHPWFNRWGKHPTNGAYQSPTSLFREFYTFHSDEAESYVDWKGHRSLPVLNYHSDKLCDLIFRQQGSALIRWLKPPYEIDGWRLDVAQMIGRGESAEGNAELVKAMGDAIRHNKPDACLIGEHWGDASAWLQSGAEDGVMNYFGFTLPLWAFLTGKDVAGEQITTDASDMETWLKLSRMQNSINHQLSQLNLLNGTDTARFISLCGHDESKVKLGIQMLFTYPGMPCLLYGDELGLSADNEITGRRTLPWSELEVESGVYHTENPWYGYYQQMIRLRLAHPALRQGGFLPLMAEQDCYLFARIDQHSLIISGINRNDVESRQLLVDLFPLVTDGDATSLFTGQTQRIEQGKVELFLDAKGGEILSINIQQFFQDWRHD